MKRVFSLCAAALMLTLALPVSALAAETAAVCYPTSVTRSEDGTELKKIYDLPQEREFVTDDGLMGTLTLQLDTVRVEVAGYGSSTKEISATRSYPNLAGQDTQYIPKTIEENGKTLTLKDIDWQTDNTATSDGYALGDRFTAVATYTGSATSSYVKGYTVTADYTGTVSRIALNRTRYVAIFEGTPLQPVTAPEDQLPAQFNWAAVLVPFGIVALVGAGIGAAVFIRRRREADDDGGESA